jgi:hypothetical protein
MKRVAALLFVCAASPAFAVGGGDVDTLEPGFYMCETADTVGVSRGNRQPEEDFSVVNASSYRKNGTIGSYLLTGDRLTMTSGPRDGERYRRISRGTLVRLDESGRETRLRCIVANRNNS